MLCLTRNRGDRVVMNLPSGQRIVVTVLDLYRFEKRARPVCRLGIEAPRDVAIHRESKQDDDQKKGVR